MLRMSKHLLGGLAEPRRGTLRTTHRGTFPGRHKRLLPAKKAATPSQ